MSTRQAEEILEHTFKQLEKMLKDVRRQESGSRQSHRPVQERETVKKSATGGSGKKKK